MKAQQAPGVGLTGEARQALRSVPDHVASIRRNRSSGGTTQAMKSRQINVNTTLNGDENKLARSQPMAPDRAIGTGKLSAGDRRRKNCGLSLKVAIALIAPRCQRDARRDSSKTMWQG